MAETETTNAIMLDSGLKSPHIDVFSPNKRIMHSASVAAGYPEFGAERRRFRSNLSESSILSLLSRPSAPDHRYFVAQFRLPSTSTMRAHLLDGGQRICLRSFSVNRWHLSGTVLVRGAGLDKRVFVRHTLDGWSTSIDTEATFLEEDLASGADRFHFRLDFPFRLPSGTRLQLAVAYCANGHTHWDNNGGLNYSFTYTSRSISKNSLNDSRK